MSNEDLGGGCWMWKSRTLPRSPTPLQKLAAIGPGSRDAWRRRFVWTTDSALHYDARRTLNPKSVVMFDSVESTRHVERSMMLEHGCPPELASFGWALRTEAKDVLWAAPSEEVRDAYLSFFELASAVARSGYDRQGVEHLSAMRAQLKVLAQVEESLAEGAGDTDSIHDDNGSLTTGSRASAGAASAGAAAAQDEGAHEGESEAGSHLREGDPSPRSAFNHSLGSAGSHSGYGDCAPKVAVTHGAQLGAEVELRAAGTEAPHGRREAASSGHLSDDAPSKASPTLLRRAISSIHTAVNRRRKPAMSVSGTSTTLLLGQRARTLSVTSLAPADTRAIDLLDDWDTSFTDVQRTAAVAQLQQNRSLASQSVGGIAGDSSSAAPPVGEVRRAVAQRLAQLRAESEERSALLSKGQHLPAHREQQVPQAKRSGEEQEGEGKGGSNLVSKDVFVDYAASYRPRPVAASTAGAVSLATAVATPLRSSPSAFALRVVCEFEQHLAALISAHRAEQLVGVAVGGRDGLPIRAAGYVDAALFGRCTAILIQAAQLGLRGGNACRHPATRSQRGPLRSTLLDRLRGSARTTRGCSGSAEGEEVRGACAQGAAEAACVSGFPSCSVTIETVAGKVINVGSTLCSFVLVTVND